MKTKVILSVIVSFITMHVFGQSADERGYLWTVKSKNKTHTIGLYGGLSGSYSEVMNKPAGYLGLKAGAVFNRRWVFGLAGYALHFDYKLNELVTDGNYHLQAGYTGVFAEYLLPLGKRSKIGFSVLSGSGIAFYQYDKDFAENRPWYQEKIDQEIFHVFEPGIEFQTKLSNRWWIGVNATYRNTSPVKLLGTDEKVFSNFNGGLSIKYGIF